MHICIYMYMYLYIHVFPQTSFSLWGSYFVAEELPKGFPPRSTLVSEASSSPSSGGTDALSIVNMYPVIIGMGRGLPFSCQV